jgi:hypothetical protein
VLNLDVGDPTRKLILLGYANHAHRDGTGAWPSVQTIADYAGCSTRSVQRHIRTLVGEGFLTEGDQNLVSHLRADRRPTVYDVAMTSPERGDNLSPRDAKPVHGDGAPGAEERGDNLSPRPEPRGDTGDVHGVTPVTPRGDKAVSPEPSGNHPLEPNDDSLRSSSPTKRATRLPEGWEPDESMRAWYRAQPFPSTLSPWAETEKFIDYWRAQPGQRGVKLDWPATWRNWMRTAAERVSNVRPLTNRHTVDPKDPDHQARLNIFDEQPPEAPEAGAGS